MAIQSASTTNTAPANRNNFRSNRPAPSPYGGNFLLTPSLADHLAPDLTLPVQYFARQACDDGMGPEKALMYAVLKDGIRCFYKNVGATRRKYKKMWLEAEEWITDDSYEYAFGFRVICDTLGIDADCLRERLMVWKDEEMERRQLTGATESVQTGRSPFPTPVDLDKIDAAEESYESEEDDWGDTVSLDDPDFAGDLVHAA